MPGYDGRTKGSGSSGLFGGFFSVAALEQSYGSSDFFGRGDLNDYTGVQT